jgi:hypothetical protein
MYGRGADIQAAAYLSGAEMVTGEYGGFDFEWACIRVNEMPRARRVPIAPSLLAVGRARWRYAVNLWAKCLKADFWPGYELDPQRLESEPWMERDVVALENGELTV